MKLSTEHCLPPTPLLSLSSEVVTELHGVPIKISGLSTFVDFDDNQSEAITSRFSNENKIQMQCMTYLDDKNTSITSILKYKCVKLVFVKYNWTLPSSAPVECLFNTARHIEHSEETSYRIKTLRCFFS